MCSSDLIVHDRNIVTSAELDDGGVVLVDGVKHAGDLERLYPNLGIEEDFFVVYGFLSKRIQALMHPRTNAGVPAEGSGAWPAAREKQARLLLEFVQERGAVHPREVDKYFSHGTVTNYWGGSSNATTHLLTAMHYRGMLRVVQIGRASCRERV